MTLFEQKHNNKETRKDGNQFNLHCHPATPNVAVHGLSIITGALKNGYFPVSFRLDGDLDKLEIPSPNIAARANDLWKNTCFEVFIGSVNNSRYDEFNIAPSRAWAAYQFESYREGMRDMPVSDLPVTIRRTDSQLEIDVLLPVSEQIDNLRVGFSSVIQEKNGRCTYWAIHHPSQEPDFHHYDSLALKAQDLKG